MFGTHCVVWAFHSALDLQHLPDCMGINFQGKDNSIFNSSIQSTFVISTISWNNWIKTNKEQQYNSELPNKIFLNNMDTIFYDWFLQHIFNK